LVLHPDEVIPAHQNELRVPIVVRLDETTVPDGALRARWQRLVGGRAGAQKRVVLAAPGRRVAEPLVDMPLAVRPKAVERLVAASRTRNRYAVQGQEVGRRVAIVGESAYPLQPKAAPFPCLAHIPVNVVARIGRQARLAVVAAGERDSVTRVAVAR